jgi:hypothetical protein
MVDSGARGCGPPARRVSTSSKRFAPSGITKSLAVCIDPLAACGYDLSFAHWAAMSRKSDPWTFLAIVPALTGVRGTYSYRN